ncbi:unnamed protein product, partial [Onchocerca flexuosa]|uniref:Uncharacterized protein n=1 Tax=Onchocerca flexuosa TaxID=387005 RepID=A0A183HKL5_9BILA
MKFKNSSKSDRLLNKMDEREILTADTYDLHQTICVFTYSACNYAIKDDNEQTIPIFHLLKYDCWPRYLRAGGVAPTFDDSPDETTETPTTSDSTFRKCRGDKKRKSLIWHGLKPRFSRWKKTWSDADDSLERNCDHRSSLQETTKQYTSPQFSKSQFSSRHSLTQVQLESSVYTGNTRDPLFVKPDSELRIGTLSKHGSIRRRGFAAAGKHRLLLTE